MWEFLLKRIVFNFSKNLFLVDNNWIPFISGHRNLNSNLSFTIFRSYSITVEIELINQEWFSYCKRLIVSQVSAGRAFLKQKN